MNHKPEDYKPDNPTWLSNVRPIRGEVQRQLIRLSLPAHVEIEGETYRIRDLSLGGLSIEGLNKDEIKVDDIIRLKFFLPFTDIDLTLDLQVRVRHFSHDSAVTGCRFINLTKGHQSVLNQVVRAYIVGDIVKNGDDILYFAAREYFVKLHRQENTIRNQSDKKVMSVHVIFYGLIGVFGLCTVLFVLANIFENVFILKSLFGTVRGNTLPVYSKTSGTYEQVLPEDVKHVKTGQILARIILRHEDSNRMVGPEGFRSAGPRKQDKGEINNAEVIASPCDCYVVQRALRDRDYIASGEVLFSLFPAKAKIWVAVVISFDDIHRVDLGDSVFIRITGTDRRIRGWVESIHSEWQERKDSLSGKNIPAGGLIVDIYTNEIISPGLIDRPAQIAFLPPWK